MHSLQENFSVCEMTVTPAWTPHSLMRIMGWHNLHVRKSFQISYRWY